MNVVFLDIDGVLNSETSAKRLDEEHKKLGHHEQCQCYGLTRQIDNDAVQRLNRIVRETNSKIVISSSFDYRPLRATRLRALPTRPPARRA